MLTMSSRLFFSSCLMICALTTNCTSTAGSVTESDGTVQTDDLRVLKSVSIASSQNPNVCLAVAGGTEIAGAAAVLESCDAGAAQTFTYRRNRLHVFASSCLTQVAATGTTATSLQIQPCDANQTSQRFYLSQKTTIVAPDRTCVGSTADQIGAGVAACTATCGAEHSSQAWTLVPIGAPSTAVSSTPATPSAPSAPASSPSTSSGNDNNGAKQTTNSGAASAGVSCPALGTWDAQAVEFEAQVLVLVNAQRAQGANCPGGRSFTAAPALKADVRLICETRAYAKAMAVGKFFSHTGQDGTSPFDRMTAAGVHWMGAAENIAEGQATPEAVVAAWMSDAGHCEDLMGGYTIEGVGYYQGYWVQDFASE